MILTAIFDFLFKIPEPKNAPSFEKTSTALPSFIVHSEYFIAEDFSYFTLKISLSKTHGKPCLISVSSLGFKKILPKSLIHFNQKKDFGKYKTFFC